MGRITSPASFDTTFVGKMFMVDCPSLKLGNSVQHLQHFLTAHLPSLVKPFASWVFIPIVLLPFTSNMLSMYL